MLKAASQPPHSKTQARIAAYKTKRKRGPNNKKPLPVWPEGVVTF
jgi:hypothetical protein